MEKKDNNLRRMLESLKRAGAHEALTDDGEMKIDLGFDTVGKVQGKEAIKKSLESETDKDKIACRFQVDKDTSCMYVSLEDLIAVVRRAGTRFTDKPVQFLQAFYVHNVGNFLEMEKEAPKEMVELLEDILKKLKS